MFLIANVILIACLLLVLHSYVIYPWLMRLWSRGKHLTKQKEQQPQVHILMAVYNEERVLDKKLASIFETNYPAHLVNLYIGSDGSTDASHGIISKYLLRYPSISCTIYRDRVGKSNILNRLQFLHGNRFKADDIIIMTDANVIFTPETIHELVAGFSDQNVAIVGANILNTGVRPKGISEQEQYYISSENELKYHEGVVWGNMMGAFGACYAIRPNCIPVIPPNFLMEDFYITLHNIAEGKKAVLNKDAICYEDIPNDVAEEFKRKRRISAGNLQNFGVYWRLLFRFNGTSFAFLSHKVIRWFGPIWIALAYISNILLLQQGLFYQALLVLQTLGLLSPVIDRILKKGGVHFVPLRFISYFYSMNRALLAGFIMYLKGIRTNAWQPTKRNGKSV